MSTTSPESRPPTASAEAASALPAPRRGPPPPLPADRVDAVLEAALCEDLGLPPGADWRAAERDVTARTAVPADARASARLIAKEGGIVAGLPVFARAFELCDPDARVELRVADGTRVAAGDELAHVQGRARALLLAERSALNLLQRLSGCATQTARFVALVQGVPGAGGRPVRLLDTRKTTPGLRFLERYAVRLGGGENHRAGLFDEVLLKENHVALAGRGIEALVRELRAAVGPDVRVTAEARDPGEARAAVLGGADVVLLDNMTPAALRALVPELRAEARARSRPLELEASGGIGAGDLAEFAATGVDRISLGALTHSVPALDLSLLLDPSHAQDPAP